MDEQEYKEICLEIKYSGLPLHTQQVLLQLLDKEMLKDGKTND